MPRSVVAVLLVALVAAAGLAACTGSARPARTEPPPFGLGLPTIGGEVESFDRLVGAWSSTVYGEPHVEVSIREGLVDLGPFTVALDRPDSVTAWGVEAYATQPTPSPGRTASPWPSPTPLTA